MQELKQKLLELNIVVDNEYLDKYINLILSNRYNKKQKNLTQVHHIIPRKYFIHQNIHIDNSKENLINLEYKDHILAHYYLALCSACDWFRYSNESAVKFCINNRYYKKLDFYESDISNLLHILDKLQELYLESNKIKSIKYKGRKSPRKGKEGRNKGYIAVNDGLETRYIDKIFLQEYLDKGYVIGSTPKGPCREETKLKISKANKGKKYSDEYKEKCCKRMLAKEFHWYTDGCINIKISKNDKIPDGFYRGRIISEEQKLKISESSKGRKTSLKTRKKISEALIGLKRPPRSLEHKQKHSKALKDKKFKWYTNGFQSLHLAETDKIPDGFYPGRVIKIRKDIK